MEAFQTVAIQGKGDAEAREEQSRNNTIALRQGLGSTSSDTHNSIFELFKVSAFSKPEKDHLRLH